MNMKLNIDKTCFFIILTIGLTFADQLGDDLCGCGDWAAYKDEKCYKLIDKVVPQSEAATICKQYDEEAVLAVIKTKEEQHFLENYLKKTNVIDNVWIGLKRNGIDKKFVWPDNTDIEYSKWAADRPMTSSDMKTNKTVSNRSNDYDCVQILIDKTGYGQWWDVMCEKKNAFVCQKMQNWSVSRIQSILIDARRNYLDTIAQQDNKINQQNKEISEIKKVLHVPIGFVYVQLSGQAEPKKIWPSLEWTQVTNAYAGYFFRAEGGGSAEFGKAQDQLTRSYQLQSLRITGSSYTHGPFTIGPEYNSLPLFTGANDGTYYGIKIKHNNEEIRPKNQAIRIWKRTA